jgi:hypothetical protein
MATIEISEKEKKILLELLSNCNFKMEMATTMLELQQKIKGAE